MLYVNGVDWWWWWLGSKAVWHLYVNHKYENRWKIGFYKKQQEKINWNWYWYSRQTNSSKLHWLGVTEFDTVTRHQVDSRNFCLFMRIWYPAQSWEQCDWLFLDFKEVKTRRGRSAWLSLETQKWVHVAGIEKLRQSSGDNSLPTHVFKPVAHLHNGLCSPSPLDLSTSLRAEPLFP